MTDWSGLRRLQPPPYHRPGPFAVLTRWRYEVVLTAGLLSAWWWDGAVTAAAVVLVTATVLAVPPLRARALAVTLMIVVPHRVRSGLVQAGVGDRRGRLPWIVAARAVGVTVRITLWLRSGTTPDDVAGAADVIATATGAVGVETVRTHRRDRVVVVVCRPRWGWPGR